MDEYLNLAKLSKCVYIVKIANPSQTESEENLQTNTTLIKIDRQWYLMECVHFAMRHQVNIKDLRTPDKLKYLEVKLTSFSTQNIP